MTDIGGALNPNANNINSNKLNHINTTPSSPLNIGLQKTTTPLVVPAIAPIDEVCTKDEKYLCDKYTSSTLCPTSLLYSTVL